MSESDLFTTQGDWQTRLAAIMDMMREMSLHSDPQAMVRAYANRMRTIRPADRRISLSRRGLRQPQFRVTRYSLWEEEINPWKQPERLPVLAGGVLADLIYSDTPQIIDDLQLADDDPAAEYLEGQRSLIAVPLMDQGASLNMVVLTRAEAAAFDREQLPELVWTSNLFGRATHSLVLADQVRRAYDVVDRELKIVADIQRALLPSHLPDIETLKLAAHYQTSQRAGGDYYDFFPLSDGKWGILIADVSGHGTPAAVMMAVTHSIAHLYPGTSQRPGEMLGFVNRHLARRYTTNIDTFVTAFYGIYDSKSRRLTYASAGHNPPRVKQCAASGISSLDSPAGFPLGVSEEEQYQDSTRTLRAGDQIIFYTDGITEAQGPNDEQFGIARLDAVLDCCRDDATEIIREILNRVEQFTRGAPATDDRTLVVAKVV
jgi:sigma-B regulation protein RsbU (phosphoserine phosphatase)